MVQDQLLLNYTKSLINYIDQLERVFNDKEIQAEQSSEFFTFFTKETEEIFSLLKEWETIVKSARYTSYPIFREDLVRSTVDNMKALIMHSYYKDVRRRKYMEINRSCMYSLRSIIKEFDHD